MERVCKACEATFEPTFGRQINCGDCKQKKTTYKQNERMAQAEQQGKFQDVEDYVMPPEQNQRLGTNAAETLAKVRQELPDKKLTMDDTQTVEGIANCLLGLENGWSKKLQFGRGDVQLLVAGHFLDAIGSGAVERVHRAPHLLLSTTFAEMYRKFLPMVVEWSKKNPQYCSGDLILDVHAGVSGTYILKPKQPPAATPPAYAIFRQMNLV